MCDILVCDNHGEKKEPLIGSGSDGSYKQIGPLFSRPDREDFSAHRSPAPPAVFTYSPPISHCVVEREADSLRKSDVLALIALAKEWIMQ